MEVNQKEKDSATGQIYLGNLKSDRGMKGTDKKL